MRLKSKYRFHRQH